ncbi:MAG TPA: hypothetical protein VNX65_05345 [Patescibacteria group bacterium]|jgi:hypothetical protein|nr:hypothetical protein [Patescibacteria group bacterium]
MRKFLKKTINLIVGTPPKTNRPHRPKLHKPTNRELIRMESKIGSKVFGPLPEGHHREFFCLDERTWVWYEQWRDVNGHSVELTTRYEIQPGGILKVQDGQKYVMLEGEELRNLAMAVKLYRRRVTKEIYKRDPATGVPLSSAV